jgi:hypothetical protein
VSVRAIKEAGVLFSPKDDEYVGRTDNKQPGRNSILPGKQEGKPIPQGLQPTKARENATPPRGRGRPVGSINRYTGALKELFLQAAENVGDRTVVAGDPLPRRRWAPGRRRRDRPALGGLHDVFAAARWMRATR